MAALDVLVDVHGVVASARLAGVSRAGLGASGRHAVDVVGVGRGGRAAAPALDAVLDTEVGGAGAVRLTGLWGRATATAATRVMVSQRRAIIVDEAKGEACRSRGTLAGFQQKQSEEPSSTPCGGTATCTRQKTCPKRISATAATSAEIGWVSGSENNDHGHVGGATSAQLLSETS